MKQTHAGSKIKELSTNELGRLEAGTVYQAEFTSKCEHVTSRDGETKRQAWSLFLVEYKETK